MTHYPSHQTSSDSVRSRGCAALDYLPALVLAVLAGFGLLAAEYAPPATGEIAVVFAPFTDEITAWQLVLAAGGKLVGPTRLSNVVVAFAADPGFAERIRSEGALFTLAATGLCRPLGASSSQVPS